MAELTPMMKQYLQIHETVPDTILFFRLGDFYEMFFDDAVTASKELDLTLTGKSCGLKERAPMCGVPYHAADNYIAKLVEKGYKVAICEQVTEPIKGKNIVEREIIRVVSPGTLTVGRAVRDNENNYLMSVYYNRLEFGISYCDLSTGEFFVEYLNGKNAANKFLSILSKVSPSEIIVNPTFFEDEKINTSAKTILGINVDPYPSKYYGVKYATDTILNHFNVYSLNALGLDQNEIILRSSGALLGYLTETQKNVLQHINKINLVSSDNFMLLDPSTKRNLELDKNIKNGEKKGSLFWVLDKTVTPMGTRMMKKWIGEPLIDKEKINERLDAVEALTNNIMMLEDIMTLFENVRDMERIISRLSMGLGNGKDLIALKESLRVIPKVKVCLEEGRGENKYLSDIVDGLDELPEVFNKIELSIDEECPVTIRDGGIIKKGCNKDIDYLKDLKKNSRQILSGIEADEKEKTGIKNLKIKYNKVFGYFFDVTNSYKDLVPDYFIRKQTLANSERYFTEELKEIEDKLLNVEDELNKKEFELFQEVCEYVLNNIAGIQKTSHLIGVLDCLCSFAYIARLNNYVKPVVNDSGKINIKDGRHPVVERLLSSNEFIYNDCLMDNDENRMLIITGPNMAGKSTYIKQIALITIMAQIGCYVPARSAEIGVTDRIFTRVGASDDLLSGQSTFMVEMSEVSNILSFATEKSLVILDEVGRGTSTFDGLSIAWAVVEYLLEKTKCKTLFATHYHELTDLEDSNKGVKNYSMRLQENENGIIFLRKIEEGGVDRSYGIEVAKLAGLPEEVILRSRNILASLEENDSKNTVKVSGKIRKTEITNQGDLFNYKNNAVIDEIKTLPIDNMTPLEVVNVVYALQKELK